MREKYDEGKLNCETFKNTFDFLIFNFDFFKLQL